MLQTGVWEVHGAEIEQLIRQGVSMAEIGRRFGVSRQRICEVLKVHNLPTRAPMLNQREVTLLMGCCQPFLTGLERKGLISPIHSGLNHGHTYYPESELKKIIAIMDKKGMSWERERKEWWLWPKLFFLPVPSPLGELLRIVIKRRECL